jgi:dTDP-4-amino-4,6-dideoxygalactose transaminase
MVVTRRAGLADRMRTMRLHGISRDAFERFRSREPAWRYDVVAPGFKYNLTDLAAAIGRVQLRRLQEMHRRREEIAHAYFAAFRELPIYLPPTGPSTDTHSWHLFVVGLRDESRRDAFIQFMADRGIGTSVHYIPLHQMTYWRQRLGSVDQDFPIATRVGARSISLPIFSTMTDEEVNRVIDAVQAFAS